MKHGYLDKFSQQKTAQARTALIGDGLEHYGDLISALVHDTPPCDYPLLLAAMELGATGLKKVLPMSGREIARLCQEKCMVVTAEVKMRD